MELGQDAHSTPGTTPHISQAPALEHPFRRLPAHSFSIELLMTPPHPQISMDTPTEADPLLPCSDPSTLSSTQRIEQQPKPYYGLLWIAAAAPCFSFMFIAIRLSFTLFGFPPSAAVLVRSMAHLLLSSILLSTYIHVSPLDLPSRFRRILLIRGFFGTVGMMLFFHSLSCLPAGDASSIYACSPILTMLLSKLVLEETSSIWDVICALTGLLGVWLIAEPSTSGTSGDQRVLGALFALLGACFSAVSFVCVRGMGTRVHFMLSVFALGIIGVPLTTIVGGREAIYQILTNHKGTGVMLLGSLTAFFAQCFLNKGLQLCKAGQGVIVKNLEVPFAYLLGLFFLGETSSTPRIFGSALVVSAVIVIALRSQPST